MLLQVLDDGRLTDGQGRTVDFRNTLIVMTSNMGSEFLATLDDGEDVENARPSVMDVVRSHFRPEFMNRIDEIILFKRLGRGEMDDIVTHPAAAGGEAAGRPADVDRAGRRRHCTGWPSAATTRSMARGR